MKAIIYTTLAIMCSILVQGFIRDTNFVPKMTLEQCNKVVDKLKHLDINTQCISL